jgi:hypothetical protein
MAAGDTGAPRASGYVEQPQLPSGRTYTGYETDVVLHSDAFNKREEAAENLYVRQKEKEKLLELRKKIREQQGHLKELEKHLVRAPLPFPLMSPPC